MNKNKILLLGGSGFIGLHLRARLVAHMGEDQVVATYNETPFPGGVKFEALSMDLRQAVPDLEVFSHAVILFASTHPDDCARNPEASQALNVTVVKAIIDQLDESNVCPVFASTEMVFDGQKGDYVESDPMNPVLLYGKQKAEVEEYLRGHVPGALILRIANVYGSDPAGGGIIAGWYKTVADGAETVRCASDYIASPVHVEDVAETVRRLMEGGCHGTYHIAGPQSLSRLEIFETLLDEIRKVRPVEVNVVSCGINDFPTAEGRPLNISMKADKLIAETGLTPRDLRLACRHLVDATREIRFLNLAVEDPKLRSELLDAVDGVLRHGQLILGPEVKAFEEAVAEASGKRYAVGVSSGSSALYLALKSLGIGPGDEVITTPLSWVVTYHAIAACEATPVPVDIREDFNLDPGLIEAAITPATKAIVPVHFTGRMCEMDRICEIAEANNLSVVEDAAQAYGARYKNHCVGSFSTAAAFSMNPMKVLGAFGEAGAITTDDVDNAEKLRALLYAGVEGPEICEYIEINHKIDTIQAAMLLVAMKYLPARMSRRAEIANRYNEAFRDFAVCPQSSKEWTHAYYIYSLQVDRRDELKKHLEDRGINCKIYHYPMMPDQPAYAYLPKTDLPVARNVVSRMLSLPASEKLTDDEVDCIIETVRNFNA